ncbi:4-hydroxybenzoyl-CoA reductase subunit gamma [Pseudodesulfovibrio hydrargyri]|uniref:4-hydroxybenzoyl-CoA reductase subunit gamma n=1 Tax=Pseudodesulfovibrio hydrargyri TaxID=2125990 RepID=A0A1J5N5K3_9BACT|nr:(2Fe-2S)-binding protein [Pseudodesulfovibrio hydrargyri]OIQ50899.1 4-hydroxybenzoyl-CoA reductase subunit gamma [Pseudodesulfovibrio hydrargyri]
MISFTLNGAAVSVDLPPATPLLHVLRDRFGLMGGKEGCGEGECGACSVLIDDNLHTSCIYPLGNVSGKRVLTIEGFKGSPQFQCIDAAFAQCGSVQCGFCTPGMILATQALLLKNPSPSVEEAREALSGNLCRCTGYNMIVEAVLLAAKNGGGLW